MCGGFRARRLTSLQIIDFGFSFSLFFAVQKGLGLHSSEIRPEDELAFNKANYAFTVLYVSPSHTPASELREINQSFFRTRH